MIRSLATSCGIALVLLTGCSAAAGGESATIPPPPSANPFTSALRMTKTWAAAELSAEVTTRIGPRDTNLVGTGEVAIDKGYAAIDWTDGNSKTRELVNDRATFVQPEPPDGKWSRLPANGRTPTSAFANPLLNLAAMSDVTAIEPADLAGIGAQRYRGTLPVTYRNLEALGFTTAELTQVAEKSSPRDAVEIITWLDPNNRIVRIDRTLLTADPNLAASSTTQLSNFGVMLDLKSPPSSNVSSES